MIKNIKKITGISLMSLGSFYSYDKYNKYKHENNIDDNEYDIGVIGGGIVGLATARQLKINYPNKKMILLEKKHCKKFKKMELSKKLEEYYLMESL